MTSEMKDDATKVRALLEFAEGVLQARERVQMEMDTSRLGVFREEDIAELPGVVMTDTESEWLRLQRLKETKPGLPSDDYVAEFLENDGSNPDAKPGLKPAISKVESIEKASDLKAEGLLRDENVSEVLEKDSVREDVVHVVLLSEDFEDMRREYDRWLVDVWASWAERERPRRISIKLYDALFQIHSKILVSEGVRPEIIWGFGMGLWAKDSKKIDMPLIEQEVEIEIDQGGDLVLLPRDRPMELNLKPYLESDFPKSAHLEKKLSEILDSINVDVVPTNFSALEPIFKTATSELDAQGVFLGRDELPESTPSAGKLQVSARWAIYVRPRSITARVQDLKSLANKIEDTQCPPAALKGFVAPEPDSAIPDDPFGVNTTALDKATEPVSPPGETPNATNQTVRSATSSPSSTYFFPLPHNAEQAAIIDMLEGRKTGHVVPVVSVTGPPGTGKSHTIANFVSHAMARGKRVLVTARTAEAITVVREKLPMALQPLVIASTGTDREASELLKAAVTELSDEITALDVQMEEARRTEIETQITECDRILEEADENLARIAQANLNKVEADGAEFTPMELAVHVEEGRHTHGWFTDRPKTAPDAGVIKAVATLKKHLPKLALDFGLLNTTLPTPKDLPTVEELLKAHEAEKTRRSRPVLDPSDFPPMAVNSNEDKPRARKIGQMLRKSADTLGKLSKRERALFNAATDPDEARGIAHAASALKTLNLGEALDTVRYGCEVPLVDLIKAASRGANGQKPAGLFKLKLKKAIQSVTVAKCTPDTCEDWSTVLATMELESKGAEIKEYLNRLPAYTDRIKRAARGWKLAPALRELRDSISAIQELAADFEKAATDARTLFPVGIDLDAVRRGETAKLIPAIEAHAPEADNPHPAYISLKALGEQGNHDIFARFQDMAEALGTPESKPDVFVRERASLTEELERLSKVMGDLSTVDATLKAIERAGAPGWSEQLRTAPEDSVKYIPDNWEATWAWAITAGKLQAIIDLGNGDKLRNEKAKMLRRRGLLMEELIRVRTMLGLKGNMTPSIQSAMLAFTQAVAKVGKGTGKKAPRFRAAAQSAAKKVSVAAPVWIMPEYRIAEQLPPDIEAFDFVILDEASQSDVTAVAALARGKQVLVVGDEEQVSPSNVGIPDQKIDVLRAKHLDGLPNANLIDQNTSIFEIAKRMHPEHHIVLREHFRSVAPIIAFSQQFYSKLLIPLRIAKPSERFDPPLVDVFLEDAEQKGKTNLIEARWIVDELAKIVADPAHDDRDIGVISLLGSEQANLIETRLLRDDRVGPEVIHKRRIVFGNARTMQGQERSIIFLSMVHTPGKVIAQTGRDMQQRLNVAMSRARDRIYLVRSIRSADLKPSDLKLKVLKHFEDPFPEGHPKVGKDILDRCDSDFEREVLGRLLDAGYRAAPQVPAGNYRIDIVVEGNDNRRLAIELDGDHWHGPDRQASDAARQAALERVGWEFWRVFGSQWESDKEYWWKHLLETLDRMDISPIGESKITDTFVELRTPHSPEPKRSDRMENVATLSDGAIKPFSDSQDIDEPSVPHIGAPESVQVQHGEVQASETQTSTQNDLFARPVLGNVEAGIGSRIELEMDNGKKLTVTLVAHTPDQDKKHILPSSPLGEALIGTLAGEDIEFAVKDTLRSARVLAVSPAGVGGA